MTKTGGTKTGGTKIGVIGAGAWGTAIAQALSNGDRDTTLWAREPEVTKSINTRHENTLFLPGIPLNKTLKSTNNLSEITKNADILLIVTPAQHVRATLEIMAPDLPAQTPIVICAKGIELKTGRLLSQVAEETLPDNKIAILTGPSFASEVANGLPCAVTIATQEKSLGIRLQDKLGVKHFRPYITDDIIAAQLGGAIKNVIAIACGIVMGKEMGESARAALITRGVAEISRLSVAMGGKSNTLLGMCGIGDLILTCSSMKSRNYSLGMALGQGQNLEDILKQRNSVTEGIHTAQATLERAKKNAVDMPITEAVTKTLAGELSIDEAIEDMLNRPFKYEMTGREQRKH